MKIMVITRFGITLAMLLAYNAAALADRREVKFPMTERELSDPPQPIAFAHDGRVGFANVFKPGITQKLFSFSVAEGKVLDQIDLMPVFGAGNDTESTPTYGIRIHNKTGNILLYGQDSNNTHKVMLISSDKDGFLRSLWVVSLSTPNIRISPAADFNSDGSKIYYIYNIASSERASFDINTLELAPPTSLIVPPVLMSSRNGPASIQGPQSPVFPQPREIMQHLVLLRAQDGARLATVELSQGTICEVMFDEVRNRAIALSRGVVYIFAPDSERLEVTSKIGPISGINEVFGQGISDNGRFLIAYGFYELTGPDVGVNHYISYDLDLGTWRRYSFSDSLLPVANVSTFHRPSGNLFVPLTVKFEAISDNDLLLTIGGFREASFLTLMADGSLSRTLEFKIPKRSTGSPDRNVIFPHNNIEVSATGALGFLPTSNGRLFTFDTLNGEIVGDELIDPAGLLNVRLLEQSGLLAVSTFSKKLLLLDVNTGPVINDVKLKRERTIIQGANFLSGARIEVNGADLGIANRSPDKHGGEIIIDKGKDEFPRGQETTVVVVNRDGLRSAPFTFKR